MSTVSFSTAHQDVRLQQFLNDAGQREKLLMAADTLQRLGDQIAEKVLDDTYKLVENIVASGGYDKEGTKVVQFQSVWAGEFSKPFQNLSMQVDEQGVTSLVMAEAGKGNIRAPEVTDAVSKLALAKLGTLLSEVSQGHSALNVTGEATEHKNSLQASLTVERTNNELGTGRLDVALKARQAELQRIADQQAAEAQKAYEASNKGQGEFIRANSDVIDTVAAKYWDSTLERQVTALLADLEKKLGCAASTWSDVTVWISKDDAKWADAIGTDNINLVVHTDAEGQRRVDSEEKLDNRDPVYHALAQALAQFAQDHANDTESPIGSFKLTSSAADRATLRGFWCTLTFTAERQGEPTLGTTIAPLPVKEVEVKQEEEKQEVAAATTSDELPVLESLEGTEN